MNEHKYDTKPFGYKTLGNCCEEVKSRYESARNNLLKKISKRDLN